MRKWIAIGVLALAMQIAGAAGFVRQDLFVPEGARSVWPISVNDTGQIAGIKFVRYDGMENIAYVWPYLPGVDRFGMKSAAIAVKGKLAAVTSWAGGGFTHGYLIRGDKIVEILPPGELISIVAMNDRGQVIGWYAVGQYRRAFFFDGSRYYDIGKKNTDSYPWGLNDRGQVVGVSDDSHAFVWSKKGGFVDLTPNFTGYSCAFDINDSGNIAGTIGENAVCWQPDGEVEWLENGLNADALAINDFGWIVGRNQSNALLWPPKGGLVDLGPGRAIGINNHLLIIGFYRKFYRDETACIWQPAK